MITKSKGYFLLLFIIASWILLKIGLEPRVQWGQWDLNPSIKWDQLNRIRRTYFIVLENFYFYRLNFNRCFKKVVKIRLTYYLLILNISMTDIIFSCRETGLDCDYIIKGETREEILKIGAEHVINTWIMGIRWSMYSSYR